MRNKRGIKHVSLLGTGVLPPSNTDLNLAANESTLVSYAKDLMMASNNDSPQVIRVECAAKFNLQVHQIDAATRLVLMCQKNVDNKVLDGQIKETVDLLKKLVQLLTNTQNTI